MSLLKQIIVFILCISVSLTSFGVLNEKQKDKFAKAYPEEINNENFPQLIESFDYPNADIRDVVSAISKLTGKNFIIDPGVKGKISIIAPTKITVSEAYRAFLSALAINDLTLVPSGKFLKIRKVRDAKRDSLDIYSGKYYPNSDQMITRVIRLKHVNADQIKQNIQRLVSRAGEISSFASANSVIITDYGSNIERILHIINELDIPGFEEQLHVIQIQHARANDLAQMINQIISSKENARNGGSRGSRFSRRTRIRNSAQTNSEQKESFSLVLPDERTNSIIVVGNKSGILKIQNLVKKLDSPLQKGQEGGAYVYHVKHNDASELAAILTDLNKNSTQRREGGNSRSRNHLGQSPSELFEKEVRVIADKSTNSLIITAGYQDYKMIQRVLSKIDTPKDQVLVKATIMQVNEALTNNWTVNIYRMVEGATGIGRLGFVSGSPMSVLDILQDKGSVFTFGAGQKIDVNIGGTDYSIPEVTGFINLLKTETKANILSSPKIHAIDNEESEIESGREIPIGVERAVGNTGNNSDTIVASKRQNVTLKLALTPHINRSSNTVRMKIFQEIRDYSPGEEQPTDVENAFIVTTLQKIKTNIVVKSGQTAVLGGLIRNKESEVRSKIPLLGDIPVLGWLFKGESRKIEKENLLIFITPTIINSPEHMQQIATDFLEKNRPVFIKNSSDQFREALEREFENSKLYSEQNLPDIDNSSDPINEDSGSFEEPEDSGESSELNDLLDTDEELDDLE